MLYMISHIHPFTHCVTADKPRHHWLLGVWLKLSYTNREKTGGIKLQSIGAEDNSTFVTFRFICLYRFLAFIPQKVLFGCFLSGFLSRWFTCLIWPNLSSWWQKVLLRGDTVLTLKEWDLNQSSFSNLLAKMASVHLHDIQLRGGNDESEIK